MTSTRTIRPATAADAVRICTIYNHYIAATTISFEEEPVAANDMARRIADVGEANLPWLVMLEGDTLIGYAYATKWRVRAASAPIGAVATVRQRIVDTIRPSMASGVMRWRSAM